MKIDPGEYCEVYGITTENQVLEYLLSCEYGDFAVGDTAELSGISRPKTYEIIKEFLKKNYVVKSRVIGKTQLYKLNKDNPIVKIFLRNFDECLNMVVARYSTKKSSESKPGRNTSMSNIRIVSAKSI